ncbi:uncharacterized protein G2W53_003937 [Senna tora]|uniref:Uncharacterized protein n=1 Tax=Senna tora TaxID=362788 RepID=A0A834XCB8_9FABA|nr:uncharacterized protein G2W53_003937 [Senna tora]
MHNSTPLSYNRCQWRIGSRPRKGNNRRNVAGFGRRPPHFCPLLLLLSSSLMPAASIRY